MEDSILVTVKKNLNVLSEDSSFDPDILTGINSTFSVLHQLGIGPTDGFLVEDAEKKWTDFKLANDEAVPQWMMNLLRQYVPLKVKMLFDPPTTSFVIEATNKQIDEHEARLRIYREGMVMDANPPKRLADFDPVWPVD